MEDLSSLEGPPLRDERFSPSVSMPMSTSTSMSPVSPQTYIAYNPARVDAVISVSPLTSATRSTRSKSSISTIPPLRSSQSLSALRDAIQVPPRPASTDNVGGGHLTSGSGSGSGETHDSTTPYWLMVNGRLVWIEDLQLWVQWDDLVESQDLSAYYLRQRQRQRQQQGQGQGQLQDEEQRLPIPRLQRHAVRPTMRTWKSLPPLPHEIHHLLPMQADWPSDSAESDGIQRVDHFSYSNVNSNSYSHSRIGGPSNAQLRMQWASLAGQLAPRTTSADRRPVPMHLSRQPTSSQSGYHYYG